MFLFFNDFIGHVGQVVAPDENYVPPSDTEETKSGFWQKVAPDPKFAGETPTSRSNRGDSTTITTPPLRSTPQPSPNQVICEHCHQYTRCNQATQPNQQPFTPGAQKIATPLHGSSIAATEAMAEVDRRVLECQRSVAEAREAPDPSAARATGYGQMH